LVVAGVPSYAGFRFPAYIISHCVWLYRRFPLSLREVEEMMLQRGIVVSHETVRQWCAKFGQNYANGLHCQRPRPGDRWHLDEVFITINGKLQFRDNQVFRINCRDYFDGLYGGSPDLMAR
jgi:putative transposase